MAGTTYKHAFFASLLVDGEATHCHCCLSVMVHSQQTAALEVQVSGYSWSHGIFVVECRGVNMVEFAVPQ